MRSMLTLYTVPLSIWSLTLEALFAVELTRPSTSKPTSMWPVLLRRAPSSMEPEGIMYLSSASSEPYSAFEEQYVKKIKRYTSTYWR